VDGDYFEDVVYGHVAERLPVLELQLLEHNRHEAFGASFVPDVLGVHELVVQFVETLVGQVAVEVEVVVRVRLFIRTGAEAGQPVKAQVEVLVLGHHHLDSEVELQLLQCDHVRYLLLAHQTFAHHRFLL